MFATRAFLAVSRTLNIGPLCQEVKTSDVLQPPVVCWAGHSGREGTEVVVVVVVVVVVMTMMMMKVTEVVMAM